MMSAEEFHIAKGVLESGRSTYNLYQVEDARSALAPIKRGYQRLIIVVVVFGLSFGYLLRLGARTVLGDEPYWLSIFATPVAMLLAFALVYLPSFRSLIIPVRGVKFHDIQKASQLW